MRGTIQETSVAVGYEVQMREATPTFAGYKFRLVMAFCVGAVGGGLDIFQQLIDHSIHLYKGVTKQASA